SKSGLIWRAKSIVCPFFGVRTGSVGRAMASLLEAGPTGKTRVKARTAQLVAAAEIHESRWCGKPLVVRSPEAEGFPLTGPTMLDCLEPRRQDNCRGRVFRYL